LLAHDAAQQPLKIITEHHLGELLGRDVRRGGDKGAKKKSQGTTTHAGYEGEATEQVAREKISVQGGRR